MDIFAKLTEINLLTVRLGLVPRIWVLFCLSVHQTFRSLFQPGSPSCISNDLEARHEISFRCHVIVLLQKFVSPSSFFGVDSLIPMPLSSWFSRGFYTNAFFSSPVVNVSSPNLPQTALKLEVPEVQQPIRSNVWILRWGKLETLETGKLGFCYRLEDGSPYYFDGHWVIFHCHVGFCWGGIFYLGGRQALFVMWGILAI